MAVTVTGKHITLAVRDLVYLNPRTSRTLSSFPLPQRGMLGKEAQTKVQHRAQQKFGLFHKEYGVNGHLTWNGYDFSIQGRIDGLYELKNRVEVEEIKSVILTAKEFNQLNIEKYPEFSEQLLFYCYLLYLNDSAREIKSFLTLVNLVNDKERIFPINFSPLVVESLLFNRLQLILEKIVYEEKMRLEKQQQFMNIKFDLKEERPEQNTMMRVVEKSISAQKHVLISAPTGTGKTAGAILPTLKFAIAEGKKLFYCTSKNTQQEIVYQTLSPIKQSDTSITGLFLRATRKMCINDVFFCHEDFCPYAKDYRERLLGSDIIEELLQTGLILPDKIIEVSRIKKLCPAEVMLDLSVHCDIIVGDYNYVFDPSVYLRRIFNQKDYSDWILIVDEAHNLYQRGLGYYSPNLERKQVKALLSEHKSKKVKVFKDICSVLKEIEKTIEEIVEDAEAWFSGQQFCSISLDLKTWEDHYAQYESAFVKYLIYKIKKKKVLQDDPLEDFYYSLRRFLQIARLEDNIYKPFLDAIKGGVLNIQCCDPSIPLGYRIEGFHSVVAMSATLDPIDYYHEVLGFSKENTEHLILDSPFPPEHRKMIIIPSISTRYSQRQKEFPAYADIIKKIVTITPGNYLVFFPSFEFMQNVNLFLGSLNIERLIQRTNMSDFDREEYLTKLREVDSNYLLLGVLGGIFSEGVDYIGDMCIGVIIFSPGLPQINYARDLIREYYDTNRGNGFEYAYVYPGINKVIQSAGRLIRSHQDKGIIVLVGERFAEEQINNLLPDYWFKTPDSLVISSDYQKEIIQFWDQVDNH
jgi:DNA excision repair protein ERCC-2